MKSRADAQAAVLTYGHILYKTEIRILKGSVCTSTFKAALLTITEIRKQPESLLTNEQIKKTWYTYTRTKVTSQQ